MITHGTVVVGTAAPVRIDGRAHGPTLLNLHNRDNTDAVYLGGSAVTVNDGFPIAKEGSMYFTLYPLEELYLIATKAGHIVSWIRQEY